MVARSNVSVNPMSEIEPVLAFLGSVLAYGGGGAAAAYLMFQFLGKSWIESKFASKLEQLRHAQALELSRLRVEIDTLLSGTIKLQEKEFETLPHAWQLLDEAYGRVAGLVSPMQQYPDLERMSDAQLEEFLAASKLRETEKVSLLTALQKNSAYMEIIFWHNLQPVRSAVRDLHHYIERHGIFCPPELKEDLRKVSEILWEAIASMEVGHEAKDYKMQTGAWKTVKEQVEPLRQAIEQKIHERLRAHATPSSGSN